MRAFLGCADPRSQAPAGKIEAKPQKTILPYDEAFLFNARDDGATRA
jgi:hypothetical protein